ncbi:glycosyltransferase family 87 protein [Pirellulales bacterium]|nr:glycosyltransferase family 87 protein [Pirellulales bacterium]
MNFRVDPMVTNYIRRLALDFNGRAQAYPQSTVAGVMTLTIALVWAPFLRDLSELGRFFDGPHYIYVAATFYDVPEEHPFRPYGLPAKYFSCHLPAYPALIRAGTFVTFGSFPMAMLLATLASSVASAVLFYRVLLEWRLVTSPLWTAVVFSLIPPRWMIYHSVGASEPLFYAFVFAAFLALRREQIGWIVVLTILASLTRITGILLVPIFGLYFLYRREWLSAVTMSLGGAGLIALFGYYHVAFGDFFAYFRWNQDNLGLVRWPPLSTFREYAGRKELFHGTELYIAVAGVYLLGICRLYRHVPFFIYCATLFTFCTLLYHEDFVRMFLLVTPFALLVGFDDILQRVSFRVTVPFIVALEVVYAWKFIPTNYVHPKVYADLLEAIGG